MQDDMLLPLLSAATLVKEDGRRKKRAEMRTPQDGGMLKRVQHDWLHIRQGHPELVSGSHTKDKTQY
jgi:hypothetical protein